MVMISHTHEFVFLKTRKTAGTSVEMFLQPFCGPPDRPVSERTHTVVSEWGVIGTRLVPASDHSGKHDRLWYNHMSAKEVRAHLGPERWARYLKVATIRNPFDRMVSMFHWRQRNAPPLPNDIAVHRQRFRDFLLNTAIPTDEEIVFLDGKFAIEGLVRYERLTQDLRQLCDRLGLALSPTYLPRAKSLSDRRNGIPVPDYYDRETTEFVRSRLAWMFEHGNYAEYPVAEDNAGTATKNSPQRTEESGFAPPNDASIQYPNEVKS